MPDSPRRLRARPPVRTLARNATAGLIAHDRENVVKILAISGSLRAASINSMLLRAAARLAPPGIGIDVYRDLGTLPLFNPDLETLGPRQVTELRTRIVSSSAILIASPEYAHGVTGVLKNALDWMVGNESFVAKPVALWNASPRATIAQAALRETLETMAARIVPEACATLPILGSGLDEDGIVSNSAIRETIIAALLALRDSSR
jgi:NAD(P)H-dependent FMN reductase